MNLTHQLQVNVASTIVLVEHDKSSTIRIWDEPTGDSLSYDPSTGDGVLQSIQMMAFQANISMLLRAELKSNGQPLPLPSDQYRVEVTIESTKSATELPLIEVMKSVVDGLNKEIIANDRSVYECGIRYIAVRQTSKKYTSTPKDKLSVDVYSLHSTTKQPIVSFKSVPLNVVPKSTPHLMDRENTLLLPLNTWFYQDDIAASLSQDGMKITGAGPYQVSMTFTGVSALSKDVDNMARIYLPILMQLGLSSDEIHDIRLSKQSSAHQQSNTLIVVQ
ncbi:hypothetical protein [Brevibacillus brevis]|uniref:hypothetical protein n=1 Tax=Brevibacillus brevis TaxID=1393 RepID=UPI0037C6C69F